MCGFCGVVGLKGRTGAEDIRAMSEAVAHRGPDDHGTWRHEFQTEGIGYDVSLAHRRLSIIDVSSLGHQPMHSSDGQLSIAFNGEIYNYRELRAELASLGARFRSESDTEVILEAYRAWGTESLVRLNGMFAFALWDARRATLLLARDPLGIKPLYYQLADGILLFGSELGALRRHRHFDPRIDRGALGRFLRHGFVSGPETIYAASRRLMPGDSLMWHAGRVTLGTFWRLVDRPQEAPPANFDAAVATLEQLLGDAVERQMISDVPLGAFLSGGIDSSTVVALMRERARGRIRTFTIGFEDPSYDESGFARELARHLGTEHTEMQMTRSEARELAMQLPALYDEPFADASAIPTALLSRLTRKHVKVALSGDGGDELFGGYRQYDRFQQLRPWLALPRTLRLAFGAVAHLVPHYGASSALRHLGSRDGSELANRLISDCDSDLLEAMTGPDGARPGSAQLEAFRTAPVPAREEVRRSMFADARVFLPDDILVKVDRASMSVGLEARVPLLDTSVVRLALSLPVSILRHGGEAKAPLRAILRRRVPRALFERPKRGFGIPIDRLLATELAAWADRYLAPARLREEGHLDPEGVELYLAQARRRKTERARVDPAWRLLCFQRWYAYHHRGESL